MSNSTQSVQSTSSNQSTDSSAQSVIGTQSSQSTTIIDSISENDTYINYASSGSSIFSKLANKLLNEFGPNIYASMVTSTGSSATDEPTTQIANANTVSANPYVRIMMYSNLSQAQTKYITSFGPFGKYNVVFLSNVPKGGPYTLNMINSTNTVQNSNIDTVFDSLFLQMLTSEGTFIQPSVGPNGHVIQTLQLKNVVGGENTNINLTEDADSVIYIKNSDFKAGVVNLSYKGGALLIILDNSPCTLNITNGELCSVCETCAKCETCQICPTCQVIPPECLSTPNSSNYIYYILIVVFILCLLFMCFKLMFSGNRNNKQDE